MHTRTRRDARPPIRPHRRPRTAALLAVTLGLLAGGAFSAEERDDGVDAARAATEQWVETRRLISREHRDWKLGREMLQERIDLVQRETASMREKTADNEKSIADADRRQAELDAELAELQQGSDGLEATVTGLEARIRTLLARVPEPLRDRVKKLSQQLPAGPDADTRERSLSQRSMVVVGILNDLNKFNREITTTVEKRPLPDGTTAEVTALYVGIGQAYYVNAKQTVAGVGRPGAEGWTWEPADEAAREIARAIAILRNEDVADFVRLPIVIE